jgi:hypothetical protein
MPRPKRRRRRRRLRGAESTQRLPAPPGAPLPSFFGSNSFLALGHSPAASTQLGRARVARTTALSAPATAGEGDHWSSRSERTVVEGAPDAELRCHCRKFSLQEEASEHDWTSLRLLRRVESCAPSTTLLRRVVPLSRYRGGG